MSSRTSRPALLLALATTLAACGGSSSPGSGPGNAITPNLTMKGVITATSPGQITVNGVAVATTQATIKVEGVERPESELKHGMVVTVRADVHGKAGEAAEVAFEDAVKGKVSAGDDDSTLRVGGQLVRVDDATEFEDNGARLGSIALDDRVRVSAVPDDRGGLRATRIDRLTGSSDDFEVKGVVSDLAAGGFTLKTSPDAGAADTYAVTLAAGVTLPAGLAAGAVVEVRSLQPVQAGNAILASSVALEDRLGAASSEAEVEGIVTSGTSASFVAAGTTVTTTDATLWTGGVAADLLPGAKVEAEGTLQADGSLAARKVSFRYSSKLQGAIAALAANADGTGSFTLNGVAVRVDGLTEQRNSLLLMANGDLVEVRGAPSRDGAALVATRLEKRSDDRPILQGVVTAVDAVAGRITVLGKTIDTSAVEAGGFHDFDPSAGAPGPSITKEAFFLAIVVGETVVKGRGNGPDAFVDPVLTAKEVELEGER